MSADSITVKSLAVKYRPRSVVGLVGQDHVTSQLKGMIKSGRFPSSILISGHTGCGKTTLSRIIASTVNCSNLDPKTFAPCGECRSCKLGAASPDYSEINIGDERGIDSIRALCKSASAMPVIGNNRVIVLDECHQLLAASANALLKTLEESPPKTLWLLATTNPEKLLATIRGRCTKFNLTEVAPDVMGKRLRMISRKEGVDLSEIDGSEALIKTIVDMSNGSMRDGISLLESALFSMASTKRIDIASVITSFTSTGEGDLERLAAELLNSCLLGNLKGIIKVCRTSNNSRGVLQKLRWLVQHQLDSAIGIAKYTPYSAKIFSQLAKKDGTKLSLPKLLIIQQTLVDVEDRCNRMSVDESVVLQSALGLFSVENKD